MNTLFNKLKMSLFAVCAIFTQIASASNNIYIKAIPESSTREMISRNLLTPINDIFQESLLKNAGAADGGAPEQIRSEVYSPYYWHMTLQPFDSPFSSWELAAYTTKGAKNYRQKRFEPLMTFYGDTVSQIKFQIDGIGILGANRPRKKGGSYFFRKFIVLKLTPDLATIESKPIRRLIRKNLLEEVAHISLATFDVPVASDLNRGLLNDLLSRINKQILYTDLGRIPLRFSGIVVDYEKGNPIFSSVPRALPVRGEHRQEILVQE